jgi:carbonic anhydrase
MFGNQEIEYKQLLINNEEWAQEQLAKNPDYFTKHAEGQHPEFLWIGCSDSRVPPHEICKTQKGMIFEQRNIANMVVHTDLNVMSVLQYAVEVLKVKHIIVCGHYGCGGVVASMTKKNHGLVNKWLLNIKDIYVKHKAELTLIDDINLRADKLVELNVIEQVHNLTKTSIVQKAWKERHLNIHGWVYDMKTGKIKDLNVLKDEITDIDEIYWYE